MEEEDAESRSSDDEEQDFSELFSQFEELPEEENADERTKRLIIIRNEAFAFINEHPNEFVEYIKEALLNVETIQIQFDKDDNDFDPMQLRSACVVLGGALETFASLRKLEFYCWSLEDCTVMSILLRFVPQISELVVCNATSLAPPAGVDLALKFHPALEKLVVQFNPDGDSNHQAWNPFPTSLSMLPKLREIEFHGVFDSYSQLHNFRHSIRGCSSTLVRVVLRDFSLDGEDNRELAEVVASNRNLTQLVVSRCRTVAENSEMLCQQLGEHTKLDFFVFGCPEGLQIYTFLADAVLRNNVLTSSLNLCCVGDRSIHATGLVRFLARLETDDSLKELGLYGYSWEQDTLCQRMNGYLSVTRNLYQLKISHDQNTFKQPFTDMAWHQVCAGLAANTTLNQLVVNGDFLTAPGCRHGVALLQNNKSLEHLTIHIETPRLRAEPLVDCIRGIEKNKGIKTLSVTSNRDEKTLLSVQQAKDVLGVFKNNYYLTSCPFDVELSEGECEDEKQHIMSGVAAFLMLNGHGRHYMTKQSTSKEQCVSLLTKVVDDHDCIFLHLRENPLLCCNIGKRSSLPPISCHRPARKKRKSKTRSS